MYLINISKMHYAVDIDIKGFFDNVNHRLLIKQLWNIGICDKQVLAILSKSLKSPIQGEGIRAKERSKEVSFLHYYLMLF